MNSIIYFQMLNLHYVVATSLSPAVQTYALQNIILQRDLTLFCNQIELSALFYFKGTYIVVLKKFSNIKSQLQKMFQKPEPVKCKVSESLKQLFCYSQPWKPKGPPENFRGSLSWYLGSYLHSSKAKDKQGQYHIHVNFALNENPQRCIIVKNH